MGFRAAFSRFLTVLAVVGLFCSAFATPGEARVGTGTAVMADGMPCGEEMPDCPDMKSPCPFMSVCFIPQLFGTPTAWITFPLRTAVPVSRQKDRVGDGLTPLPPARPLMWVVCGMICRARSG